MSTWLWIVIGVVGFFVLLYLLGLLLQRAEKRKLSLIPELIEEKNTEALTRELSSWTHVVQIGAAKALAELRDPAAIPALLQNWLERSNPPEVQEAFVAALARMPGEQLVPLLLEKAQGENRKRVANLLREFDLPAARDLVARVDEQQAEAKARRGRRGEVVALLLTDMAEQSRHTVKLRLPLELGGGTVAGKVIGGMLTGGMMAVTPNRVTLDGYVKLPELCALCGCLPGTKERYAHCVFQFASAGWSLTGVNASAEAYLTYKVCADCNALDDRAAAIRLFIERDPQKAWWARLQILNAEIAQQVEELNAGISAPPATLAAHA
jgi:hypothetical protein